jgi:type IV pilus assembly protein PilV
VLTRIGGSKIGGKSAGFTMLEVLVTLLIIAISVLGSASLQAFALKVSQSGQLRSQAVILAGDLLERIEANNPAAVSGNYAPTTLPTSSAKDCAVDFCQPNELATYDLVQFNTRLQAQLPGASLTITFVAGPPASYTVRIDWEERIARTPSTSVATSGTTSVGATGKTEKFSFTVTKSFSNRAAVV